MKRFAAVFGLLVLSSLSSLSSHAANPQPESCAQIRALINAQTDVLTRPNTTLLGQLSMHRECRFTAAEAYRAAYGAKPFPGGETGGKTHGRHRDRDDD